MKLIKTTDAVGTVLCHDITRIIPGVEKGPVFKKGHIVREEDIPVLLSVGKENLYVWEKQEGILHENEAAQWLKYICVKDSPDFICSEPSEGKIEIRAGIRGLLKINKKALDAVNSLGEMMIAAIHGNFPVNEGEKLAATRIIPLVIPQEKMEAAKAAAGDEPVLRILPFKKLTAGIVTTGNEVYKGRIKDAFGPVLKSKLAEYNIPCERQIFVPDDKAMISSAVTELVSEGVDLVLVSGGMSVDPDDCTPGAIKDTGARIVSYGAPVLPGAMFLLSYLDAGGRTIPVIGLPGCVMYARRTIFDLILPRVIAGEELEAEDINSLGEGGLCLSCSECTFPHCGFGK